MPHQCYVPSDGLCQFIVVLREKLCGQGMEASLANFTVTHSPLLDAVVSLEAN